MSKRKYMQYQKIAYVTHGYKPINSTLHPIISILYRDCTDRSYSNPVWYVCERCCNGTCQDLRHFRTKQEAIDWMSAFGEVKKSV